MKEKYAITIGRDFGSGGLEIAEKVAERLNIEYYNKDLVELVSELNGIDPSIVNAMDEKLPGLFASDEEEEISLNIYENQAAVMQNVSNHGSAIFLGRCADAQLQDNENVLSIFVTAPMDFRAKRIKEEFHFPTLEAAKKKINKVDRDRRRYYEHYSGRKWGDINTKDFIINSESMGIDGAVELIVSEVYRRWGK